MSHQKRVRIEKGFSLQIEARLNQRKMIQCTCINQEETGEGQRRPKKSQTKSHKITWLRYEKEAMFCYFFRKSKKKNPFASAEGCKNVRTSALQRHKDCKVQEDAMKEKL